MTNRLTRITLRTIASVDAGTDKGESEWANEAHEQCRFITLSDSTTRQRGQIQLTFPKSITGQQATDLYTFLTEAINEKIQRDTVRARTAPKLDTDLRRAMLEARGNIPLNAW